MAEHHLRNRRCHTIFRGILDSARNDVCAGMVAKKWQNIKIRYVHEKIEQGNKTRTEEERSRQIFSRFLHFGRCATDKRPCIHCKERTNHCGTDNC